MGCFTNHKLIYSIGKVEGKIMNEGFRVCDFKVENTGVFLYMKIYCSKEPKKYKAVKICLTDFAFQILKILSPEQKKELLEQFNMAVSE